MYPNLYFFDIDGTMVGDVIPQIVEWELLTKYDKSKLPQFKKNLVTQLQNGLLRPHLATFIDSLKSRSEASEFYVYTASETKWAHYLVGCIEQVIGTKFNRPLFTRTHCTATQKFYQKSFAHISNILLKKHKEFKNIKELLARTTLYDNSRVLIKSEDKCLHLCPTYNFRDVYDVLRLLPEQIVHDNYMEIASYLAAYNYFPSISSHQHYSYHVFKSLYFSYLGAQIKENIKTMRLIKDDHWLKL